MAEVARRRAKGQGDDLETEETEVEKKRKKGSVLRDGEGQKRDR